MKRQKLKIRRKTRVRMKIRGVSMRPRLTVFRSNRYVYAQIIDDAKGETLVSVSQKELARTEEKKIAHAWSLGKLLAQKAKKKKITAVVFDRGSYAYHGRVEALAAGAREGGLTF